MNWLDLLIVLFIGLGALGGYQKGFIQSFAKLASYLVGLTGALVFYQPFALFLKNSWGLDSVIMEITYAAFKLPAGVEKVPIQNLSLSKVQTVLNTMGVPAEYKQQMNELVQQLGIIAKQSDVSTVGDALYYLIAGVILKFVAFLLIVFVLELLTSLVIKAFVKTIKVTPAALLDNAVGLLFGTVKNCLIVAVMIFVLTPVLSLGTLNKNGVLNTLYEGVQGSQISTYVMSLLK